MCRNFNGVANFHDLKWIDTNEKASTMLVNNRIDRMERYKGYIYALLAAIFNAMIGIFSVKIMAISLGPYAIAFYKCFIAFLIITSWLVVSRQVGQWFKYIKRLWWQLLIASFFGFFVLYFFETNAYKYEKVTIVVFMLLGSSVITTFILSCILSKKWLRLNQIISCTLAISGLVLVFGVNKSFGENSLGILFALIAGVGYGVFLTISPRFNIGSGLMVVNSLILFGMLYLFVPFAYEGLTLFSDINTAVLLILLALLPTIGGFLCTVKALTFLKSETVQLLELSEPVFALIFSTLFLSQYITFWQLVGGLLLIVSIYVNAAFTKPINDKKLK
jgi:drug/metabolite transporter (DMT)-like permease